MHSIGCILPQFELYLLSALDFFFELQCDNQGLAYPSSVLLLELCVIELQS